MTRSASALVSSFAIHWIAWTLTTPRPETPATLPPIDVDAIEIVPPPPDPPEPPQPLESDPGHRGPDRPKSLATSHPRPAPAPPGPPVQAPEVRTSEPASSAVVADEGPPLVVGTASEYAGGLTSITGSGWGGAGGLGGYDRSRPARLAGAERGSVMLGRCPWPSDASKDGRPVVVHLVVEVSTDGTAIRARVTYDPGQGFGEAARNCALRARYRPGRDAAGRVARVWTAPFQVIFDPWLLVK